ncbi:MAG: CHASE3 domain-containing protein [Sphingosinicella sp.]|nr:CHASE3 domain-containing protein [Sphingosinicella sp.]
MRIAAVVAVPLILLLLGALQVRQSDYAQELRSRVTQAYESRARLERFLSLHQDLETGQRGYIVTGQPEFLEPYYGARKRVGPELSALKSGFANERAFANLLPELAALSHRKIDFTERTVRLRQQGRTRAAIQLVAGGEGKHLMDRMRMLLARMDAIERSRLQNAAAAADKSRSLTQGMTFGLEALLLLLLGGAAWAIYRSVNATRRAVGRLRDLSARQQAIFEEAMDGMITNDPDGRIESLNRAAAQMWGYEPDELLGRNLGFLIEGTPSEAEVKLFLDKVANNVGKRANRPIEFIARRSDGSNFTADIATSAVPLGDGLHFIGVIRDITDRKRVERMKTEFVSTVSHELRTPLTSIAGSLGLLSVGAAGPLPERAQKLIRIAHSNSERLVRLINDILDLEKIESGKMTFHTKPVSLRPLVEQAIQSNLAFADGYGVKLTLADEGGDPVAIGDGDRLTQVVTNLLSNAAKFSPNGSEVLTSIQPGETNHRISIRDQGPGISKEFQARLFSKFAQEDASDTREKGGTGLGLSIVKQIVEGLGGTVSFESELGKGTVFHVDLPAAAALERSNRRQILICQEDKIAAAEMEAALHKAGFGCDVAPSCSEMRRLTADKTYAAIILDLALPGEESIGLIRDLRADPRYASVPILVASAEGSNNEVSQTIAVVDWLHKPISAEKLVKGVRMAIPADHLPHILHVEDDLDVLRVVAAAFEGRAHLDSVTDLDEAKAALKERRYDLVILDLALPGGSGLELLPVMHRDDGKPIPAVIFSAQDEDPELARRVEALLTKSRASLDDLVQTVETLIAMYMKKSDKE